MCVCVCVFVGVSALVCVCRYVGVWGCLRVRACAYAAGFACACPCAWVGAKVWWVSGCVHTEGSLQRRSGFAIASVKAVCHGKNDELATPRACAHECYPSCAKRTPLIYRRTHTHTHTAVIVVDALGRRRPHLFVCVVWGNHSARAYECVCVGGCGCPLFSAQAGIRENTLQQLSCYEMRTWAAAHHTPLSSEADAAGRLPGIRGPTSSSAEEVGEGNTMRSDHRLSASHRPDGGHHDRSQRRKSV